MASGLVKNGKVLPKPELKKVLGASEAATPLIRPRFDSIDVGLEELAGPAMFVVQNPAGQYIAAYDQVAVLSINMNDSEFQRIHVLFEGELVEGFGRQPRIYTVSLLLPFTADEVVVDPESRGASGNYAGNGWKIFGYLYDQYFRATQLARSGNTLTLHVKGYTVKIAPIALMRQYGAEDPRVSRANMTCYVFGPIVREARQTNLVRRETVGTLLVP